MNVARDAFVKNMRFFMEYTGISQADICRKLDVSSATVSNWCTGERYPRIDAMQRLANMFGVKYSVLSSENGSEDFRDRQILDVLRRDDDLQTLFDLMCNMSQEDIQMVLQIVKRIIKEK